MICSKYIAVHFTSFVLLTKLCHGIVTTRIIPPSPLKRLIFTSTKSARGTECSMSDWDAENGVWLGDRATSDNQLPSPLYLFGYGSLLWRPGELLGNFTSSSCSCSGWQRLFAQRSSDHRGSTDFPGFVATLVEATYLKEKLQELSQINEAFERGIDEKIDTIGDVKISCSGLVWLIPEDCIKGTIAELDYRERGGYHRHIVRVKLKQDTELHSAGTVVDALVYSGSTSNPNFHFMPRGCRFDNQEIETDTETATVTVTTSHCATADIIAAAVGPSGSNSDYLFNLNDYLHENGISDGYIQELSAAVALRMGPWRDRPYARYLKHTAKQRQSSVKDLSSSSAKVSSPLPLPLSPPAPPAPLAPLALALALAAPMPPPPPCPLNTPPSRSTSYTEFKGKNNHHLKIFLDSEYLIGWGSNEHLQLGARTPMTHPTLFLQSASNPVHLNIEKINGKTLCDISTNFVDSSTTVTSSLQPSSDAVMLQENITKIQYKNDINEEISFCQVLCGGASSAFLGPLGDLIIWGKILKSEIRNENTATSSSITTNLNSENKIEDNVKHKSEVNGKEGSSPSEFFLEQQDSRLIFKDIVGAALGHDHILLLTKKGWVVPIGDNYWGQCQGPKSFFPQGIFNFESFSSSGSRSSGGAGSSTQDMRIQYSSLANGNNEGYSYSDNKNGNDENSIDSQQQHLLDEEPEVQVLKLACGVRHSAAITKQGDLHVWGSGSAACIVLPTHSDTKSNENTCTSNKDSVAVERDLEQLQSEAIHAVTWRPDGAKLIDVSCGMEVTVVIDDKGRVWSLGSNKHGSLGRTFSANLEDNGNISSQMDKTSSNIVQVQVDSSSQEIEKLKTRKRMEKDSTPRLVEGLESGVRWQRVVCGWSHTIVRGVRIDGSVACAAWGRRNLGQYPVEDSTREQVEGDDENKSKIDSSKTVRESEDINDLGMGVQVSVKPTHSPQRLILPHGLVVREVWAGSEYTVVADQAGYLWASGWNEHGNLGRGTGGLAFVSSDGWVKVMQSDKSLVSSSVNGEQLTGDSREHREGVAEADLHVRLSVVWEGAVSCGGGHVLALTEKRPTK